MAITVNNYQSGVDAGGTTVTVSSYAIGAGTAGQRKLIVSVQMEDFGSATLSGIAFGGTSLTQTATVTAGSNSGWIYELDDTDIGAGAQTADVVATFSAAPDDGSISVIWLDGVAQGAATQTATNGSTGATETSITATLTSVAANAIIVNAGGQGDPETMTQDGTQTLAGQVTNGSSHCALAYEIPGSGNHTQGWTGADMRRPNLILAEYAEFSGATYTIVGASGSYTYTGTAASLTASRSIASASGSYAYSGTAAALNHGFYVSATSGSYTYSGANVGLFRGLSLAANSGAYTYTGPVTALSLTRVMAASSGSYAYSGTDAALTYISGATLTADSGAYTYSGSSASLVVSRAIAAASGAYSYSGTAASLNLTRHLSAASGAYTYSGASIDLLVSRSISAQSGAYAYNGSNIALTYSNSSLWTEQADASTTWSSQSDSSTVWSDQADVSSTWTIQ